MHNFHTIIASFLDIGKQSFNKLENEAGNSKFQIVFLKLSDLQVIALSMTAKALIIDSEKILVYDPLQSGQTLFQAGNISRVRLTILTRASITGTSTNTPTTVASVAPESMPNLSISCQIFFLS
jgi:hypothetical protein